MPRPAEPARQGVTEETRAPRRHRSRAWLLVRLAAAVGFAAVVWSIVIEPAMLRTTRETLELGGWPPALGGLQVALLADLHVGSPSNGLDRLGEVVRRTNEVRPDLVLLAGDFVISGVLGGRFVDPERVAGALHGLRARLGVYAVLGNHDHWFDGARVRRALEDAGIPVLDDRAIRLEANGSAFWLAGVSDWWEGQHDVAAALAQVTDAAPILLLTHNPDVFPDVPLRVSLTLAGHTHGGQVYLPLVGRPIVPSAYGERYAAGLVIEDGRQLFVTVGVGTSLLPLRFLVPPEIALLELRPAP